jgi:hypothetical protein
MTEKPTYTRPYTEEEKKQEPSILNDSMWIGSALSVLAGVSLLLFSGGVLSLGYYAIALTIGGMATTAYLGKKAEEHDREDGRKEVSPPTFWNQNIFKGLSSHMALTFLGALAAMALADPFTPAIALFESGSWIPTLTETVGKPIVAATQLIAGAVGIYRGGMEGKEKMAKEYAEAQAIHNREKATQFLGKEKMKELEGLGKNDDLALGKAGTASTLTASAASLATGEAAAPTMETWADPSIHAKSNTHFRDMVSKQQGRTSEQEAANQNERAENAKEAVAETTSWAEKVASAAEGVTQAPGLGT